MTIRNVLHVVYSLEAGGAERVAVQYARFLDRSKYRVLVCSLTRGGPFEDLLRDLGTPCFILGKHRGADLRAVRDLARFMRTERVDIVHLHNFSPNLWGTVAAIGAGVR